VLQALHLAAHVHRKLASELRAVLLHQVEAHPVEAVGQNLRDMMSWLRKK